MKKTCIALACGAILMSTAVVSMAAAAPISTVNNKYYVVLAGFASGDPSPVLTLSVHDCADSNSKNSFSGLQSFDDQASAITIATEFPLAGTTEIKRFMLNNDTVEVDVRPVQNDSRKYEIFYYHKASPSIYPQLTPMEISSCKLTLTKADFPYTVNTSQNTISVAPSPYIPTINYTKNGESKTLTLTQ